MDDRTANWDDGLDHVARSDVGMRRNNNQDSFAEFVASSESAWKQRGHLFVVADGMGAHAAGELASKLAADNIPHLYSKMATESPTVAIRKAIEQTNDKIHGRGEANAEFHGMGTTSSCLLLTSGGAIIGHVGDSRIYRLRGNRLDQLTFDHSLQWEMRRANGQFHNSAFAENLPKNIITRSLGPNAQVQVDVEGPFPLQVGDTFLLCSDGLTGQVKNEELGMILTCTPPDEAARALIDLANLRGGPDNITVEIIKVTGEHISQGLVAGATADDDDAGNGPHGWITTLAIVSGVASAGLAVAGFVMNLPLAILGGVFLVVVAVGLSVLRKKWTPPVAVAKSERRQGGAPYVSCLVQPGQEFSEHLGQVFQQLREAAQREDWQIDWSQVKLLTREIDGALTVQDYRNAIRHYCRAISFMMSELHDQGRRKRETGESDNVFSE